MTALQNFVFEENLVRIVEQDNEPWFVGKDVCACLSIKNHNDALGNLDEDERGVGSTDPLGSNQDMVIISEPGVYRLVFRSRKPEAERFKRWLAHEVLPQLRRTGQYTPQNGMIVDLDALSDEAPLGQRVDAVRLAVRLFGKERAAVLWEKIGLPPVPPMPSHDGRGEAASCLRHVLDNQVDGGDRNVRDLIRQAFDEVPDAEIMLRNIGIRITFEKGGEGFRIASNSIELRRLYAATEWNNGKWTEVIRRLAGTHATGTMRVGSGQTRGTFVPSRYLDEPIC